MWFQPFRSREYYSTNSAPETDGGYEVTGSSRSWDKYTAPTFARSNLEFSRYEDGRNTRHDECQQSRQRYAGASPLKAPEDENRMNAMQ